MFPKIPGTFGGFPYTNHYTSLGSTLGRCVYGNYHLVQTMDYAGVVEVYGVMCQVFS